MVATQFASRDLFIDDVENTIELGWRRISVTMIQKIVRVGEQLQSTIALFSSGGFDNVFADVQHITNLTKGHQEFHHTNFAAVFALSGANNTHLRVGRTTQKAADTRLASIFVNDISSVCSC